MVGEGFWGYWSIAFFQQVASLGNNIAIQIAAGSSLKVSLTQQKSSASASASFFLIFGLATKEFGISKSICPAGSLQILPQ